MAHRTALAAAVAIGAAVASAGARADVSAPVPADPIGWCIRAQPDALADAKADDRPNVAAMVDYSFLRIQKDDIAALRGAGALLRHVHIANPEGGRTHPMDASESDYASFFGVLKEIGYGGGFSVHARTSAFATDAPRAIAFLRGESLKLHSR